MACHVRDGMAHFALLLTLCETIQRYFQEYSMCVKLPATLNVQLEYVFYTWGNAQSLWVPLFCHQVIVSLWRHSVLQWRLLWVLISSPQEREFPVGSPPPFLGQTIDRYITVKPVGGWGGGRAWGEDLIVFVGPGVGHLTDLVLPGEGICESFFARRGDIWLPTWTKKLRSNIFFSTSTLHTYALRSKKIWKSWRPTRTSKSWVDFTVLSSNFVCFSMFVINWTS